MLQKIDRNLYRVLIPFERITTTVYLAVYEEGAAVIDAATTPSDAEDYILPALHRLGVVPDVRWLLLTHTHGDHAGGLARLSELLPRARVGFFAPVEGVASAILVDGEVLLGGLRAVHLPGHTADAVGYLDMASGTLLSGDCLQLDGVDIYRSGIGDPVSYRDSVEKLRGMDIRRIVAAHEYDPLGSIAEGREAVLRYLDRCLFSLKPSSL